MKDYQKDLDGLRGECNATCFDENNKQWWTSDRTKDYRCNNLQELVDKAIPMKILHHNLDSEDPDVIAFNKLKGFCPKDQEKGLAVIVGVTDKFCLYCGQVLHND